MFGCKNFIFQKIFLDISLSIAIEDASTPECVYFIFCDSNMLCIYPSSPNCPCNALNTMSGLKVFTFLKNFH